MAALRRQPRIESSFFGAESLSPRDEAAPNKHALCVLEIRIPLFCIGNYGSWCTSPPSTAYIGIVVGLFLKMFFIFFFCSTCLRQPVTSNLGPR